jgi:hypothetical protein
MDATSRSNNFGDHSQTLPTIAATTISATIARMAQCHIQTDAIVFITDPGLCQRLVYELIGPLPNFVVG